MLHTRKRNRTHMYDTTRYSIQFYIKRLATFQMCAWFVSLKTHIWIIIRCYCNIMMSAKPSSCVLCSIWIIFLVTFSFDVCFSFVTNEIWKFDRIKWYTIQTNMNRIYISCSKIISSAIWKQRRSNFVILNSSLSREKEKKMWTNQYACIWTDDGFE